MTTKIAADQTVDLSTVLSFLQEMKTGQDALVTRLDTLEARAQTLEGQQSKMIPMEAYTPSEGASPGEVMARLGRNGQIEGTLRNVPSDDWGRPLGAMQLQVHPSPYAEGQRVRINPETAKYGWPTGMTWENRLKKFGADGYGTVWKILHYERRGEWKYTCRFKGVGGSSGFVDMHEHELLPA